MSEQGALHARALPEHSLEVRVLRSSSDHNRFWWMVRDASGQLIATSATTYTTETEARRAARMQLPELFVAGFSPNSRKRPG